MAPPLAGAVNAVMLASGLAKGGRPRAKRALHRFWERVSEAWRGTGGEALPRGFKPFICRCLGTK